MDKSDEKLTYRYLNSDGKPIQGVFFISTACIRAFRARVNVRRNDNYIVKMAARWLCNAQEIRIKPELTVGFSEEVLKIRYFLIGLNINSGWILSVNKNNTLYSVRKNNGRFKELI